MTHVVLIAPSFSIPEHYVIATKKYLEELGMKVTVPDDFQGEDLLCAHSDEKRLSHLKDALMDPTFDVIWSLRGGYGLTRLMPALLSLKKPEKEKLFIGFSDGTALHLFLNQNWGWSSLHGPGANQLAYHKVGHKTIEATLHYVKEGLDSYQLPLLKPLNKRAEVLSSLIGTVTGGNLCILTCSLGTDWQFNLTDKILFLEDVDERGYRVDRMLNQLDQAGYFNQVKAIIFGDFVGGNEANGSSLISPVLERFAKTIPLPIFSLSDAGHGEENIPLPFNVTVTFPVES